MNRDPRSSATEADRDMRQALGAKLDGRVVVVDRYTAVGSTAARIPISASQRPTAVTLINARLYFDSAAPLALTPNFNFVWDAVSRTAQVYEPSGLTANTVYRLVYQVIGG
jgi:hypothetical protein